MDVKKQLNPNEVRTKICKKNIIKLTKIWLKNPLKIASLEIPQIKSSKFLQCFDSK